MSGELYWATVLLNRGTSRADIVLLGPLLVVAKDEAGAIAKVTADNPTILGVMPKAYVAVTQYVKPGLDVIKGKVFKPDPVVPPSSIPKRPTPQAVVRHADEGGSWGTGTHHSGD